MWGTVLEQARRSNEHSGQDHFKDKHFSDDLSS
jgi:hypothetical protein